MVWCRGNDRCQWYLVIIYQLDSDLSLVVVMRTTCHLLIQKFNLILTMFQTGFAFQIQVYHCWACTALQPVGQWGWVWRFQWGWGRGGQTFKDQGIKHLLYYLIKNVWYWSKNTTMYAFVSLVFVQMVDSEDSDVDTGFYSDGEGAPPPKRRSLLVALRWVRVNHHICISNVCSVCFNTWRTILCRFLNIPQCCWNKHRVWEGKFPVYCTGGNAQTYKASKRTFIHMLC